MTDDESGATGVYQCLMKIITETQDLIELCDRLANERFVTVDTEFIREKTYWPKLCLVQVAGRQRRDAGGN